jgi:hypothetical protein
VGADGSVSFASRVQVQKEAPNLNIIRDLQPKSADADLINKFLKSNASLEYDSTYLKQLMKTFTI